MDSNIALELINYATLIDEIRDIVAQLDANGPQDASVYLFYSGNLGNAGMQEIAGLL